MIRNHQSINLFLPAFVFGTMLLTMACLDEGPVLTPSSAQSEESTPLECSEILGKAFASVEERQWFLDNCSKWHGGEDLPEPAPTVVGAVSGDSPECAAIRGKPYESAEQRRWFLANCVGNDAPSQSAPPVEVEAGDRSSCAEIRGTQYRSQPERRWFLANCVTPVPQADSNGRAAVDDDDDDDDDDDRGRGRRNGRDNGSRD